nr:methyl-CpG-binding domain-containing protein 9 [Ipomoea batatas]
MQRAVISILADLNNENVQLKPEKKEKVKSVSSLSDIIMKQCRIVLRQAIVADEDRVFCNLLGRTVLMPNDNDDEGRLGYPAMVSRPLDFRTIDLRLAAGSYGGSYEAFVDDVREVWNNICTAYGDQPDLLSLAGTLSQKFEELYEKEVLSFVQKTVECKDNNCLNSEAEKESDDFISRVNESSLPKAPWDEGICKVCGMDKDDDNVLLCDSCDSEYHTYCLDPPLVRIPDGNWYCPSCVAKKSLSRSATYITQNVGQCRKKRYQKEFSHKLLEALSELAKAMELKEYWELTLQERIFLMKFLCDEALNSAIIRDHIDQCASLSADLQQKLRSLNSELKVLKLMEEFFTADLAKVKNNAGSNAFSSGVVSDGKLNGQVPESGAQSLSSSFRQLDNGGQLNELKESILQWVSCKSKHSNFADGLIQKKKDLSASDSSKGRKVSDSGSSKGRKVLDSCFLVTKAMTVLSKKFGSFNEMDGTEVCKNPGLPVKVPCKGGIYRCLCLEPLWISRPHCYSCHQTFSNAEELAQHASNKCKSNSEFHESNQIMENSSKPKKVTRSESCQEKSLDSNGINQASKSRKQGSVPAFRNEKHSSESASVEHQDQAECPFKSEEIKRKFIVQRK